MVNPIRQRAIEGLKKGDSFCYERIFTPNEIVEFGNMTRDYNPVHYDLRWAAEKGFSNKICHGLLIGSMICEFGGQVGWLATGMTFNFIKPVFPGDTVTCNIIITKAEENGRAEAEACFTNQQGQTVCCAFLKGRLPLERERKILKQMVTEGDPTNKLSNSPINPVDPNKR